MKERTVAPWNQHIVYLCYHDIGQMDLISKEPAPEECGVVKFLHVGLLLLGQPEASSGKEQAAVRGRCSRCWPAGCRSGSWS